MFSPIKSAVIAGSLSLVSVMASADITVENNSNYPIRVSFHGDGCRLFDGDRFNYAPCEEKEIPVNTTAHFHNIIRDFSKFTRKERAIVPRIIFSSLGLSYLCRVELFYLTQLCNTKGGHNIPQCQIHIEHHVGNIEGLEYIPQSAPLTLRGATLSADTNYSLTILPGYGYFPQPYVACELSIIKSHSPDCEIKSIAWIIPNKEIKS